MGCVFLLIFCIFELFLLPAFDSDFSGKNDATILHELLISNLKTVLYMSAKSVYISASKFLKESSDTYAIKGILA